MTKLLTEFLISLIEHLKGENMYLGILISRCVEFLVGHGGDLFIENCSGQTACDLAVACGHHQVLETNISLSETSTVNVFWHCSLTEL